MEIDNIIRKPNVYFTSVINPDSLVNIYMKLHRVLQPRVAVKISSGEPGGHNFLNPQLIKPLIDFVPSATIVECNTAYKGKRNTVEDHIKVLKDHGFLDIADCDIMDAEGEMTIPCPNYYRIPNDIVGKHLGDYNSMIVLSHFKGHAIAGYGGAIKNIAIGCASPNGKINIHSGGTMTSMPSNDFADFNKFDQKAFLESLCDAADAIINYIGKENMVYINIANNLSIDCDCVPHPVPPKIDDIGIFASLDPVAVDQACIDAVYNLDDIRKKDLIERIEERQGKYTLACAERIKMGRRDYNLINLD